jgi:NitT/TauT family transport system substrate-binding protein
MKLNITLLALCALFSVNSYCADKLTIRLGILAFGTVNWEITALKNLKLIENSDFQLEILPVANPQAGKIALQAGAVDIIVSDWVWVSRLRTSGADFTFYPYSTTSGALIVPQDSNIKSIQDLAGKRLAIAGGELDKNWLLLQALALQQHKINLSESVEKIYGAPPLLNQQIIRGRVDAVINYWHFAARLEAQNFHQIINGKEILQQLGINQVMPTLGYVFNRHWANQHKPQVNQFLKFTQTAKNQLCQSDSAWSKILPLTRVKDLATQSLLRKRYCLGRVQQWGKHEQQAADKIYSLLKNISHEKLTGQSKKLQTGTFWTIDEIE